MAIENAALVERFSTPLVVYDLALVAENVRRIGSALDSVFGGRADPAFAVKSCYLPQVLADVRDAGWGVEVMSGFELDRVLHGGVPGGVITLTGLGWGDDVCEAALDAGVRQFVVDTDADLAALARAARRTACVPEVLLRVNLAADTSRSFLPDRGRLGHPPGTALTEMARAVAERDELELAGFHVHQFNRLTEVEPYDRAMQRFAEVIGRMRADGVDFHTVDLGGGLECLSRLDQLAAPMEEFIEAAGRHIAEFPDLRRVAFEFGRAVVGDAAVVLGRVTAVKQAGPDWWVIVDASTNTLIPIPGAQYPPVLLADADRPRVARVRFADGTGSPVALCEVADFPLPQVGDLVAFTEAGAYTTVFTELWAAALPGLVIVGQDGVPLARPGDRTTARTWETWYGPSAWTDQV